MKSWALYPTISAPMPFQMALDEILFRRLEGRLCAGARPTPVVRFYYSSEPWITLGYAQDPALLSRPSGFKVCRRITGGGYLEHGQDIIFSIAAHKQDDAAFSGVQSSYVKIHEAVKTGLERMGYQPRFYRCSENLPKGADCFRFPIPADLALAGRKIAGGSQKRSAGALLHQESVEIRKGMADERMIREICAGIETVFGIRLFQADLDPVLLKRAEELAENKYSRV